MIFCDKLNTIIRYRPTQQLFKTFKTHSLIMHIVIDLN